MKYTLCLATSAVVICSVATSLVMAQSQSGLEDGANVTEFLDDAPQPDIDAMKRAFDPAERATNLDERKIKARDGHPADGSTTHSHGWFSKTLNWIGFPVGIDDIPSDGIDDLPPEKKKTGS
jgi:hypothetical protein